MKNVGIKWGIIFLGMGVVLCTAMYFLLSGQRQAQTSETIAPPAPFGANNVNEIKVDTFLSLVHKAYGGIVTSTIDNNKLSIDLKGNELTKDFFNSNNQLLQFGLNDFGFKIDYNPEQKSLLAVFLIKANAVQVPNDVMIKILDKTLNK